MSDKDGGPAFPLSLGVGGGRDGAVTLWDYFAASAMIGLLSCEVNSAETYADSAEAAATQADAMLAERKKRGIGQ